MNSFSEIARSEHLRVTGLSYRFGSRSVLSDISFALRKGELLGVLGPNGAGKSTLFQILCGTLAPQEGTFFLEGTAYHPQDPRARRNLGVVFQQPSLDLKLSARENLMLAARLYGISFAEAKKRSLVLLAIMDLAERAEDRVETFSGGMRRRLEIIRALIHEPEFLILDEPTVGLDEVGFQAIWQRLNSLRKSGNLTMLLTTHRADEAEQCDRLIILHEGKVLADDTPASLISRVGGDVLNLALSGQPSSERLAEIRQELSAKLGRRSQIFDHNLVLEERDGHAWIPKIVEAFPAHTFSSIQIHRPTVADLFVHLTGKALEKT